MASSDVVATAADNVGTEATCDTNCAQSATCYCSGTCEEEDVLAMMGVDGEPVKLMVMEERGGECGRGPTACTVHRLSQMCRQPH